jgi:hypothetical protein
MIQTALDELRTMLPAWLNKQLPLWCQTKYIVGLTEGVYSLVLPTGVIDVLDVNLRTTVRLIGDATSSSGVATNAFDGDFATVCALVGPGDQNIALTLTDVTVVQTVGVLPATSGVWNISFQWSADGVAWTTFYANPAYVATDSQWLWVDAQGIPAVNYYRMVVAATSLPVSVRELVFANAGNEINMARINRDDYFYLPDKNAKGRPVQFWLDRQRSNCTMNLWPAPDLASRYRQITMIAARQIEDVGTLQQELEVPQLWWDATVDALAKRLAQITPEVKLEMLPVVKDAAEESLALAFAENRDRSPINIVVDISAYTQ